MGFLYAAVGVTLLAIVGYLLYLNGRLTALRHEQAALKQGDGWHGTEVDDAGRGRPASCGAPRSDRDAADVLSRTRMSS